MSRFDHSDLDGHLLTLLVAVVEERSVTRAAQRLGVSQSAVSHLLDKLRAIVGDPLVVRSGRSLSSKPAWFRQRWWLRPGPPARPGGGGGQRPAA